MLSTNPCICLAAYDWLGDLDVWHFHDIAVRFFEANGVAPNACSLHEHNHDSNHLQYKTVVSRLNKKPHPPYSSLELYHTVPSYAQLAFGWDVTAVFEKVRRRFYLCCDQTLAGIDLHDLFPLLDRLSSEIRLRYAIGYVRPMHLGPGFYADGMIAGLNVSDDWDQGERIGAWFREQIGAKRHLQGLLRDVYPLNVLSEPHLAQRIEGQSVTDWIASDPNRGTLRPLGNGAALWSLSDDQIPGVREALTEQGLLIAYLPRDSALDPTE